MSVLGARNGHNCECGENDPRGNAHKGRLSEDNESILFDPLEFERYSLGTPGPAFGIWETNLNPPLALP
jgi:hypothetical protein